jgi:radical SAM superfamily enzyme YgiQ (UPF0313 family)
MKVLLIFPPHSDTTSPYLSIPSLTAFLRSRGIDVIQRDLNIEAYDLLLRKEFLNDSFKRIKDRLEMIEKKKRLTAGEKKDYKELIKAEMTAEFIIGNIESAKNIVTTADRMPSIDEFIKAQVIMNNALRLIYTSFGPVNFGLNYGWPPYIQMKKLNADEIISAAYDDQFNLFRHLFKHYFLESLLAEKPDIVGISVTVYEQIIPAFTLAALIKEKQPEIHVTIGGNIFSGDLAILSREKDFFNLIDTIIIREGEIPLLRLIDAIEGAKDLSSVPHLILRERDEVKLNEKREILKINALPTPDFEGFPLKLYQSPRSRLVYPLQTSKGCYWGKCAYCDMEFRAEQYEERSVNLVVEDCVNLQNKYGASIFTLGNCSLSPRRVDALAKGFSDADLKIEWSFQATPEKNFSPELCNLLRKAGCTAIYWGVASYCDRVLKAMKKKSSKSSIRTVLENSKKAGILNHCYIMVGFPTEEREEAEETLQFLFEFKDRIDLLYCSQFMLIKHCEVEQFPDRFHISELVSNREEYGFGWDYKVDKGMNRQQAAGLLKAFQGQLRQFYPELLFWGLINRNHMQYIIRSHPYVEEVIQPQLGDIQDWKQVKIKLKKGVFIRKTRPDISEEEKAEGEAFAVFDLFTGKFLLIKRTIADFLDLCNRGYNVADVAANLGSEYQISEEKARETILIIDKKIKNLTTFENN